MNVGKYDPCPCGSGKQYKWCCWEKDRQAAKADGRSQRLPDGHFIAEINPRVDDQVDDLLERLELGERQGIKERLDALVRDYPRLHTPRFAMGVYYLVVYGDHAAALPHFEEAVKIFPAFGEAHLNLANCAMKLADIKKAALSFRQAIRYCPDDPDIVRNARQQLRFLEQMVTKDKTFASLDEYIASQTCFEEAFAAMKRSDYAQAEAGFRKVLAKDYNHVQSHGNLGLVLAAQGRKAEALASLDRALAIDPNYEPASSNRIAVEKMTEGRPLQVPFLETRYYQEKHEEEQRRSGVLGSLWKILKRK